MLIMKIQTTHVTFCMETNHLQILNEIFLDMLAVTDMDMM
jgi:hypothetical protein